MGASPRSCFVDVVPVPQRRRPRHGKRRRHPRRSRFAGRNDDQYGGRGCRAPSRSRCTATRPTGRAEVLKHLEAAGAVANVKVQAASRTGRRHLQPGCLRHRHGGGHGAMPTGPARSASAQRRRRLARELRRQCADCPTAPEVHDVQVEGARSTSTAEHARHRRARERQRDAEWKRNYRATRPKVERKFAHLMTHRHGGRRARMRGRERVAQDFVMRCAAVNLKRLAGLGLRSVDAWAAAPVA